MIGVALAAALLVCIADGGAAAGHNQAGAHGATHIPTAVFCLTMACPWLLVTWFNAIVIGWKSGGRVLIASFRWGLTMHRVKLLRRNARATLMLQCEAVSNFNHSRRPVLVLEHDDTPNRSVSFGTAKRRPDLPVVFNRIQDFLGERAVDRTLTRERLDENMTVAVSRAPRFEGEAGRRLLLPDQHTALVVAARWMRYASATLVLLGVAICLTSAGFAWLGASWASWVVSGCLLALGTSMAKSGIDGLIHERVVQFDRRTAEVLIGWGLPGRPCWRRRIPLDKIAGLQICSERDDSMDLVPYELNLVLREPAGERITLLLLRRKHRVMDRALQLSEFLGKPVWDHA
jgi:hypothetical protein